MPLDAIPQSVRDKYRIEERGHACAILANDYPSEFRDLMDCHDVFVLRRSRIMNPGGGRLQIPATIDGFLRQRDWREQRFDIAISVDGQPVPIPTHKIDNFRNEIAVEVQWNNKTEFYDRDLNNFRLLKDLRVLAVGVIITRLRELRVLFEELGQWHKYGTTPTHWDKLIPKVDGGGAGGCPLLLVGIGSECYDPYS